MKINSLDVVIMYPGRRGRCPVFWSIGFEKGHAFASAHISVGLSVVEWLLHIYIYVPQKVFYSRPDVMTRSYMSGLI
jgi:hypothetical protein